MEDLKDQFLNELRDLLIRFSQINLNWILQEGETVWEDFITDRLADDGLDAGVPISGGDDLI